MTDKLLRYKGYLGSVEVDLDENCLHGKLLHVNDLVTYEADSPRELWNEFQAAVDDYLNTCKELGKDPEQPFRGSFNVRIGPALHKTAAITAVIEGVTLNEFVRLAIEERLSRKEGDPQSRRETQHPGKVAGILPAAVEVKAQTGWSSMLDLRSLPVHVMEPSGMYPTFRESGRVIQSCRTANIASISTNWFETVGESAETSATPPEMSNVDQLLERMSVLDNRE